MTGDPSLQTLQKAEERQQRAFRWVRMLADLPRLAGSEAERAAAHRIADELRELGFDEVSLASVPSRPRVGLTLALHSGGVAVGLLLGGATGAALALLCAVSFAREFRSRRPLLSRLLPAPPSVNVVARAGAARPRQRVVLSAHIDCAQAGWIFSEGLARLFARGSNGRARREGPPPGPHRLPEALVLGGAAVAVASALGAGGLALGLVSFAATVGLLLACGLTLQWASAAPSPGANDNASAVAAMLTCAEQLLAALPEDTELWVVGTGAEEVGCCGMHAFVDERVDWPREGTWFVNFECVGGGRLHWARSEGTLGKTAFPPTLIELARRVAASGAFGEITGTDLMAATDGHAPARRGFPTVSLISLEENGVPRHYHRPDDTAEGVDLATVVRAADFGAAVARVALRGEAGPIAIV